MTCEDCKGTGEVSNDKKTQKVSCFNCNGTGEMCDVCGESVDVCICEQDDG